MLTSVLYTVKQFMFKFVVLLQKYYSTVKRLLNAESRIIAGSLINARVF